MAKNTQIRKPKTLRVVLGTHLEERIRERARASHRPIVHIIRCALARFLGDRTRPIETSSPAQRVAGDHARLVQVCTCAVLYCRKLRDELCNRDMSSDPEGKSVLAVTAVLERVDYLIVELQAARRQLALDLTELPVPKPIPRTRNRDLPQAQSAGPAESAETLTHP